MIGYFAYPYEIVSPFVTLDTHRLEADCQGCFMRGFLSEC